MISDTLHDAAAEIRAYLGSHSHMYAETAPQIRNLLAQMETIRAQLDALPMARQLYTEILEDESDEPGIMQRQLGEAVHVWSWMQNGQQTVAGAALAFNTTPELIRAAIDEHPWCLWSGPADDAARQIIEHDGE